MPAGILYPYPWLSSLLHLQRRCIPSRHDRPLLAKERTIRKGIWLANPQFSEELGSFTCPKAGTWDRLFYFPSEGKHAVDFFNRKNPTASVESEPAMLGTRRPACLPLDHRSRSGCVYICKIEGVYYKWQTTTTVSTSQGHHQVIIKNKLKVKNVLYKSLRYTLRDPVRFTQ
jgi:hypothetical protein